MITYRTGNLLDAEAEALVNTVNTVGVMGRGIALMFKDAFPAVFSAYQAACNEGAVKVGRMFVVERQELVGPKWIINFPTKQHWRSPSRMEWIAEGLDDLKRVMTAHGIRSVAVPPLGAGNGGLAWPEVRALLEEKLRDVDAAVLVYEPTATYQNVAKRTGVEALTPARAIITELVRRYWFEGAECSLLEIHKLAWFLERSAVSLGLANTFRFQFRAGRYGPVSDPLRHVLDALDGSYLHCDKRIADAGPLDVITVDQARSDRVIAFLSTPEAKAYQPALQQTAGIILGYESPFGMELLATVDWLRTTGAATAADVMSGLSAWPVGGRWAERKVRLFDARSVALAFDHLAAHLPVTAAAGPTDPAAHPPTG